VELFIT